MHDSSEFEALGLPSVYVASSEFDEATRAQASGLGFTPRRVLVPHPIQDRTDEEMQVIADAAVDEIVASLTAAHGV